ncbi:PilZ domain-containing protein [Psychrobacillus sp.]|uniref:PilZ domain-containing protein n=1 Tax=Psychrobacillus sp. TaxID=1871623 RepID=UPI0028BEC837|nr:PilZ domain-containing protein [Psychrobacillus sp.]
MIYKRNEYFRYTFGEPCEATFRLIKDANEGSTAEMSKQGKCFLIDISPSGLRVFSELHIAIDKIKHVEINFTLDETPISMLGEFIWSRRKMDGVEYGIQLVGDAESEQLIISELKMRSKKEHDSEK